jgi:hypothetical protein
MLTLFILYKSPTPQMPITRKEKKASQQNTRHTNTYNLFTIHLPLFLSGPQNKNKYITKTIRRLLCFFKPHVLFLSNNFFLGRSQFSSYTLRVYIYFYHHFDSSSSSVVLFFFFQPIPFYEKSDLYVIIPGQQKTALRRNFKLRKKSCKNHTIKILTHNIIAQRAKLFTLFILP